MHLPQMLPTIAEVQPIWEGWGNIGKRQRGAV